MTTTNCNKHDHNIFFSYIYCENNGHKIIFLCDNFLIYIKYCFVFKNATLKVKKTFCLFQWVIVFILRVICFVINKNHAMLFFVTNICIMNIMTIPGPMWLCVEDSSKVSSDILLTLYSILFQLQCFGKISKMAAVLQQLREIEIINAKQWKLVWLNTKIYKLQDFKQLYVISRNEFCYILIMWIEICDVKIDQRLGFPMQGFWCSYLVNYHI